MKSLTERTFNTLKIFSNIKRIYSHLISSNSLLLRHFKITVQTPVISNEKYKKKKSDYSLDTFFVNTCNMLFLTCVLCHSVRQAPRIVYDEVRAYVMSLAVLCGEHRVCLNTLQLCQRIQSRTEVELEKTYCRIPIAISSIWDIPDSYHPGHL